MEPDIFSKELLPDIIFTPCLAFDIKGYRLGYGGGYYDKTFAHYKKLHHSFITVAVALLRRAIYTLLLLLLILCVIDNFV